MHLFLFALLFVPASHDVLESVGRLKPVLQPVASSATGENLAAESKGLLYLFNSEGEVMQQAKIALPRTTLLAFRPDGKQLAVACGMPGQKGVVQLYELPKLELSKTVELHKDLIQGLAYSPDGKRLATGSYDRLIKVVDVASGKTEATLKDHSDAVYALAWKPDGKRLASVSADRTVKVWDPASGKRLFTLSDATDWLYAVAWSNDGKQIAAGGVDKSIRWWLIENDEGKLLKSTFAHEQGIVQLHFTNSLLYSLGEEGAIKSWDNQSQSETKRLTSSSPIASFAVQAGMGKRPAALVISRLDGIVERLDVTTGKAISTLLPEKFPMVQVAPGTSRQQAPVVATPSTLAGSITRAGVSSFYCFNLKANEELGLAVQPSTSKLEPMLKLIDEQGQVLAKSSNGSLGYRSVKPQTVTLVIRDKEYRGGESFSYRIQAGPVPVITSHFPLSVQAGTEIAIDICGVHLQGIQQVKVKAESKDGDYQMTLPWPVAGMKLKLPEIRVVHQPQVQLGKELSVPATGLGRFTQPDTDHRWQFNATKGKRLVIEVHAARLGSELDSVIDILDAAGKPLERARLSTKAKTYITLRDRDANDPGLRLENWAGFNQNDYLYIGTELLRLRDMPKGPDEDCKFWTRSGKRMGYLGTTPRAVPLGGSIYQVEVHPPGTPLPNNGFPNFTLYERNDDGGQGKGADSYLLFDPPADGSYIVQISDAERRGGENFGYSLSVREPKPSYTIDFSPREPKLTNSGAVPITVTVVRHDGYAGPIDISLQNLDSSLKSSAARIEADEESTVIALEAKPEAKGDLKPFTVVAEACIAGKVQRQQVMSQAPKLIPAGDIVTTAESPAVQLLPGGSTQITIKIERRNGFKGRIPLEVRGLPYGVQVIDVGLNGILITERDTVRTFTLKAEPWVKTGLVPLVVVAKREGKGTEHGSQTIMLNIENSVKVTGK